MAEFETIKLHEALAQGYEYYLHGNFEFQSVKDLQFITDEEIENKECILCEKEPYSPSGISSADIAEMLADNIADNHGSDTGDDTDDVYNAIKSLDFSEAEEKITQALSYMHYYRPTNIRIVMD